MKQSTKKVLRNIARYVFYVHKVHPAILSETDSKHVSTCFT